MGHHSSLFLFITPFSISPLFFLQPKPENAVTVAVSSRVLFRTEREQKVFEQKGVEEYLRYQIEHENEPFAPGPAFPFVKVKVTQAYTHRHDDSRTDFQVQPERFTFPLLPWASGLTVAVSRQALEAVNAHLRELYPQSEELFDIVLVTYNHAHVGIRLINTINHHSESDWDRTIKKLQAEKSGALHSACLSELDSSGNDTSGYSFYI